MDATLLAAFLIGLFSTVHCIGMCGGIMGALTFSLPQEVRANRPLLLSYLLFYNLGRLLSYTTAGLLLGVLGQGLYTTLSPDSGYFALQIVAALIMAAMGLYLAGWFPRFAQVERIGGPIWRRLEPVGRRLLPVKSPWQALLYGVIWGWLPCGLVYSALLLSITRADTFSGGLFMLAFGLGTLPSVLGIGLFSHTLGHLPRSPHLRRFAGILLIAMGLAGVLFPDWFHHLSPMQEQEALECSDESL